MSCDLLTALQRAAVGGLCNLAMSDVIIERMLDKQLDGHERYMKIFLVIAHSDDDQAAVYSLGALANLCCCREAVDMFFELDGPRHLKEVVQPSRHQLAHPFALIVSAVTGEQFEGGLGLPKATLDAVNRIIDASLLAPLLVFASLPASGAQAHQVPRSSHHARQRAVLFLTWGRSCASRRSNT